jgi:hypothetical protein
MATMQKNIANVQSLIASTVELLDEASDFEAHHALNNVVMTAADRVLSDAKNRLQMLLGHRLPA